MNAATMYLTRSITTDEELRNVKILIRELEQLRRKVRCIKFIVDGCDFCENDFSQEEDMQLDSEVIGYLREFCETISVVIEVCPHSLDRFKSIKRVLFSPSE